MTGFRLRATGDGFGNGSRLHAAGEHQASRLGRQAIGFGRRLRRAAALFVALMGELSDQRSYARHLAVHGRAHSAAEWRRFSDTRLKAKFGQPKCC